MSDLDAAYCASTASGWSLLVDEAYRLSLAGPCPSMSLTGLTGIDMARVRFDGLSDGLLPVADHPRIPGYGEVVVLARFLV